MFLLSLFLTNFFTSFHQILMSITVIVTVISAVVIVAIEGLEPFEELGENPHPAFGLLSIICAIIQPIMALFRPHPGTRFVRRLPLIMGLRVFYALALPWHVFAL